MKSFYILLIAFALFAGLAEISFADTKADSAAREEHTDKAQKYTGYVSGKAVVLDHQTIISGGGRRKIKTDVYDIAFQQQDGQWKNASSVWIGQGLFNRYDIGDTIQVYYHPAEADLPVIDEYEYSTKTNTFDYRNLLLYGGIALIVLTVSYPGLKKAYFIVKTIYQYMFPKAGTPA
jgi:hypothetical protein